MPEHKGKVEQGGVHYVARNWPRRPRLPRHPRRQCARPPLVCARPRGTRCHGTLKQQPSSSSRAWSGPRVGRSRHALGAGHLEAGQAPPRLPRGLQRRLLLGAVSADRAAALGAGTTTQVQCFHDHALVASHLAARPGQRRTLTEHLPPDKVHSPLQHPAWCQQRAAEIGRPAPPSIAHLLGDRPLDRLRSAQGVLRLAQRYGAPRLEAACARASAVGEYRYQTVKTILAAGLDRQPPSTSRPGPRRGRPRRGTPAPGPPSSPTRWRGRSAMELTPPTHPHAPHAPALRAPGDARGAQPPGDREPHLLRGVPHPAAQDEVERRGQSALRLRLRRAPWTPARRSRPSTSASTQS